MEFSFCRLCHAQEAGIEVVFWLKAFASGFAMAPHRLRVVVSFKVFSHFQPRFAAGDGRHSSSHCDMSGPTQ